MYEEVNTSSTCTRRLDSGESFSRIASHMLTHRIRYVTGTPSLRSTASRHGMRAAIPHTAIGIVHIFVEAQPRAVFCALSCVACSWSMVPLYTTLYYPLPSKTGLTLYLRRGQFANRSRYVSGCLICYHPTMVMFGAMLCDDTLKARVWSVGSRPLLATGATCCTSYVSQTEPTLTDGRWVMYLARPTSVARFCRTVFDGCIRLRQLALIWYLVSSFEECLAEIFRLRALLYSPVPELPFAPLAIAFLEFEVRLITARGLVTGFGGSSFSRRRR